MSALNPTLAGAVAKAERGIAFLRLPGATSDHLRQAGEAYEALDFDEQTLAEEDLMFAVRVHFRSRGIPVETWHEFAPGFQRMGWDATTWEWLVRQIKDAGDFQWPHCCTGCQRLLPPPEEGEADPSECYQCKRAREVAAQRQASGKPSTKKGKKAAPAPEEGGDA